MLNYQKVHPSEKHGKMMNNGGFCGDLMMIMKMMLAYNTSLVGG